MDGASPYLIGLLVFLIGGSAFFSASETALTSLNRIRLLNMVEDKIKNADKISRLLEDPNRLLSSILVGNNLVNNGASALTTALAIQLFHGDAGSGATAATAFITVVILIFGEITPKTIAAQQAEKVALVVVNIIAAVVFILRPVVVVLNVVTSALIRLFGGKPGMKLPLITEAELKTIVNVSHEEGVLESEERIMINNIFNFGEAKAKDVMTPRTDMVAVPSDVTYGDFVELVKEEGFSRFPVYDEDMDDIVGILYVKDVFFVDEKSFSAEKYMREPFYTYESKPVTELFAQMRQNHLAVAIVLDEYGGTSGLATMEDIIEEIMGEIADEYDDEQDEIEVIKEDEFVVDGSTRLEEINKMVGNRLESDEVDTIAGYVLMILGNFPEGGEILETDGLKFVVEEMDKNRISKLRIYINQDSQGEAE
ncbi:magnesium and cobalt efflux protein CorC [Anaerotignum neopropionicum]|uniref:Magnesium and cobalt efflux protein CorC n=1 Tax=Anaerotignum neopropionicum TaxID=36847 RepID=A0A136WDT3_9FIRM|nr:hemolysin family protein [Anaerotignum neopropionicum]KXL52656.1 magnesium and cobalt efflux protein CorC [Anaerotignum neopropionicum]